jgi:hypothetical protein
MKQTNRMHVSRDILELMLLSVDTKSATLKILSPTLSWMYRGMGLDLIEKLKRGQSVVRYVEGHPYHCATFHPDERRRHKEALAPSTFLNNQNRLIRSGFLLRLHDPAPMIDDAISYTMPELDYYYMLQGTKTYSRHLQEEAKNFIYTKQGSHQDPDRTKTPPKVFFDWRAQPNKLVKLSGILEEGE